MVIRFNLLVNRETGIVGDMCEKSIMILKMLCLLGIIASVAVSCPTKQFCFPKQWHSKLSFVNVSRESNGSVQIAPGNGDIFIDDVEKKFRMDYFTVSRNITILVLYKEKVGYLIENNKCKQFTPSKEYNMTLCTPGICFGIILTLAAANESAIISKPYRLGYKPSINVVDYDFPVFISAAQFSVADCTAPVALRLYATMSGEFSVLNTILFEDYFPTKPDPKEFIVPKICTHAIKDYANLWKIFAQGSVWEKFK